jgi:hypothetical protein
MVAVIVEIKLRQIPKRETQVLNELKATGRKVGEACPLRTRPL